MTIIDDYLDYQDEYSHKYGENTCVLMQVGHFFEAYAVDNEKEKSNSDNMYKMANIMNIQMTRKNKSILENSRKNPLMIGVNLLSVEKYIQILLNKNYTIVLIEQVTEPPEPERKVTQIYSPGTSINFVNRDFNNYCVSLYFEGNGIGMAALDLSTGMSEIYESYSPKDDTNYCLDETFRFIQAWNPKELMLINCENPDSVKKYLELNERKLYSISLDKHYNTIDFQKTFLSKIYNNKSMLSIHEYLDLENAPLGTISFMKILDFAHQHNEELIRDIDKPSVLLSDKNLILANNAINQLNLVSRNQYESQNSSVFSVINFTKTSIGKRHLYNNLVNPIKDPEQLNARYDAIDNMRPLCEEVRKYLAPIVDFERLHRKINLNMIQPADFVGLSMTYNNILKIIHVLPDSYSSFIPDTDTLTFFKDHIALIGKHLNMNIIGKYHLDKIGENFFNRGIHPSIDAIQDILDGGLNKLEAISRVLSRKIDDRSDMMVKVDSNDRDGYFLQITTKRAKILKKAFQNIGNQKFTIYDNYSVLTNEFEIKTINTSQSRITGNLIRTISKEINDARCDIQKMVSAEFFNFLRLLDTNKLKPMIAFIGNIDTFQSAFEAARIYGYTRPTINSDPHAPLSIDGIRHPIIERLQNQDSYVLNDIIFDNSSKGILLYGTNASGKSSLMKAIGINVIMAQAGLFVAANKMGFAPFDTIFTRINNNDNLFKGESSFAVEMSELRGILKRATKNSLILGDELCAGTESISALSIFAASVKKLAKVDSTFIFATHLHELGSIESVTSLDNVKMFHLKVIFDETSGKLIYDRKLSPGSGNAIYGLEVCKSMDMDEEFLADANIIRRGIMNINENILDNTPSKYNSKVIMDTCGICSAEAIDTHHIKFQKDADENNLLEGHITKNTKSNLIPLCKVCHDNVHHGNLEIRGYKQTSEGTILDYEYIKNEVKSKKKYSPEQVAEILEITKNNELVSNKLLKSIIEEKMNLKLSVPILSKIKNGTY